jgi:hypothetical protein
MTPRGIASFLFTNLKNENSNVQLNVSDTAHRPTVIECKLNTPDTCKTASKQSNTSNIIVLMNEMTKTVQSVILSMSDTPLLTPFFRSVIRHSHKLYATHYEKKLQNKMKFPVSASRLYPKGTISDSHWLPLGQVVISESYCNISNILTWNYNHLAFYNFDNKDILWRRW